MKNNENTLPNGSGENQAIKESILSQQIKFYQYLRTRTATGSMVVVNTGIPHKNVTRFKREFEKSGLLVEVNKVKCSITKRYAWEITTNPEIISQIKGSDNPND